MLFGCNKFGVKRPRDCHVNAVQLLVERVLDPLYVTSAQSCAAVKSVQSVCASAFLFLINSTSQKRPAPNGLRDTLHAQPVHDTVKTYIWITTKQ